MPGSSTAVTDCAFIGNSASFGGGIYNAGRTGNVTVTACAVTAGLSLPGLAGPVSSWVSRLVALLASDAASGISGQLLMVDGGYSVA